MGTTDGTDETLAAGGQSHASDERELERGELVGRYVVLAKIGAGGMGVVYAAYDPELDRKVALKLLHAGEGTEGGPLLVREAQALAKLSHPHVVGVHDVGTAGMRVWLAMEFVAGQTLGAWMAASPRGWREVLAVYVAAGRGLAAAHERGLVHRDFKPDNVMLGEDGRARVMDFGLARATEAERADAKAAESRVDADATQVGPRRFNEPLTRAGALTGTPGYMAPEQFSGMAADARSDQFSFGVALWEGLYGERPFRGSSLLELAASVLAGGPKPPPRSSAVPAWLRKAVSRALAREPAARWPDMAGLLDALERGQARSRTRRAFAATGVVAMGVAGALGVHEVDQRKRIAACEADGASIGEVWNDAERAAVRAGLLATGAGHAAVTAERVMPWLDEQAEAWRVARTESCLDATVREVWDGDTLDRAVWCLDERRLELGALVEELEGADTDAATKAVSAAAALRRIEPCRDEVLLHRLVAPPTEGREAVQVVRERLSRVDALEATGAYAEALALARTSLEQANGLAWAPLVAAARLRVGDLLEATGAYAEAESMLESAYFAAARAGALEETLTAAQRLVFTVGYRRARHEDGERWWKHLEVAREALPDAAGLREAASLGNLAAVRNEMGAYAEAATLRERALALYEGALGPDHPEVAMSLGNLAMVRYATGEYPEAATLLERALPILEKALGPDHPDVAQGLSNLAMVRYMMGEHGEAASLFERALTIREKALGEDHPEVAASLHNVAMVRYAAGAYSEAVTLYERALAIDEKALGKDHPEIAASLGNLASVHYQTGAYAEATALYERALAIRETALGPDHPDVAMSLGNLALARYTTGAYPEAATLYERALAIDERALGEQHPHVPFLLVGLADVALAQRRAADAVAFTERALRLREGGDAAPVDVAEVRFLLARALVAAGRSRERAVSLARAASDAYREGGDPYGKPLAEVDAFLREHAKEP